MRKCGVSLLQLHRDIAIIPREMMASLKMENTHLKLHVNDLHYLTCPTYKSQIVTIQLIQKKVAFHLRVLVAAKGAR